MRKSIFILLLCSLSANADIIPSSRVRTADMGGWTNDVVGVSGGIPNSFAMTVFTNFTSSATLAQINNALTLCPSNQVVSLGPGTYTLGTSSLENSKSGVVLRGSTNSDGTPSSILNSSKDLNGSGGCIVVLGDDPLSSWPNFGFSHVVSWTAGYAVGTTNITVSSTTGLSVGSIVGLDQLNDQADVTSISGEGSDGGRGPNGSANDAGRLLETWVEVKAINGTTVTIWPPLSSPYWSGSRTPQMFWMNNVLKRVGLENFVIDATSAHPGGPYSANIYFRSTWNCWVKNVKSIDAYESHISMEWGGRSEIRHCRFFDTQLEKQRSYGFQPSKSSFNWMEDCIWDKVTAVIQIGCGGDNVISYNYATNVFYDPAAPVGHAAFWQHQGYNSFNLIEGNYICGIDWDEYHGSSGYQTAFRNRVTGKEPNISGTACCEVWPTNYFCNFVGNVCGTKGVHVSYSGDVFLLGQQYGTPTVIGPDNTVSNKTWITGNYDPITTTNNGVILNTNADQTVPSSLLYAAKPAFYGALTTFPAFGTDSAGQITQSTNAYAFTNIPAGYRALTGNDTPAGGGGGGGGGGGTTGSVSLSGSVTLSGTIKFSQ